MTCESDRLKEHEKAGIINGLLARGLDRVGELDLNFYDCDQEKVERLEVCFRDYKHSHYGIELPKRFYIDRSEGPAGVDLYTVWSRVELPSAEHGAKPSIFSDFWDAIIAGILFKLRQDSKKILGYALLGFFQDENPGRGTVGRHIPNLGAYAKDGIRQVNNILESKERVYAGHDFRTAKREAQGHP